MEGIGLLITLGTGMFLVSVVSGTLPSRISLGEKHYPWLMCFAAGLLIGCALLILPEGIHTFYDVLGMIYEQPMITNTTARVGGMTSSSSSPAMVDDDGGDGGQQASLVKLLPNSMILSTDLRQPSMDVIRFGRTSKLLGLTLTSHRTIGLTLAAGFIIMIVIEQILSQKRVPVHVAVSDLGNQTQEPRQLLLTAGLMFHAIADGVGLGAASVSDNRKLEMTIFFAILLHKIPSAFGLGTILLHEKYSLRSIRRHLIGFSLAAPLASILTYVMLVRWGRDARTLHEYSALLVIFSAGTFLYVALVETLPGIYRLGLGMSETKRRLSIRQLLSLIIGILVPFLLMAEHG
jgi:solute carrier family 39 (zinc transporter), member 9